MEGDRRGTDTGGVCRALGEKLCVDAGTWGAAFGILRTGFQRLTGGTEGDGESRVREDGKKEINEKKKTDHFNFFPVKEEDG